MESNRCALWLFIASDPLARQIMNRMDRDTADRGKFLAAEWECVNFEEKTVTICPLDEQMVADLEEWRRQTHFAHDRDWIFASPPMHGRQPLWPEARMRNSIAPAARRAGITKRINWHVFRHSFSTLLAANGEDVKTVQSLLRHANPSITLGIYTHAVSEPKRQVQSKVVEIVLPRPEMQPLAVATGGTA